VITLDTSAILALLDATAPQHEQCAAEVRADGGPFVVPVPILGEACYMIEHRLGAEALLAFLVDAEGGLFALDCADNDIPRVRELVGRYDDLALGFADASVAACAERNGRRVLTLDRRDFDVVGRELGLEVLPQ
jgi:hypothetical protein